MQIIRALLAFVAFAVAYAATTEYPISTGQNLANGKADLNWSVKTPSGTVSNPVLKTDNAYWKQFSKWANWISPPTPSNGVNAIGVYTYTATFSINNFDPASYTLSAKVCSDDTLANITVNGNVQKAVTPCSTTDYMSCTTKYTLSSHFQTGTNTIQFLINNIDTKDANPTGLYVEFDI